MNLKLKLTIKHKITDTEELGVDNCLVFMRKIINEKIDLVKNNKH